jgi:hypothetical protein
VLKNNINIDYNLISFDMRKLTYKPWKKR